MNEFTFVGRMTSDPELKYTPNGTAVCKFTLAVNRPNSEDADFFTHLVFHRYAEVIAEYGKKGRLCLTKGRIRTRKYEKDGKTFRVTEFLVDKLLFLDKNGKDNAENTQSQTQGNMNPWDPFPSGQDPFAASGQDPFADISDDDLPF